VVFNLQLTCLFNNLILKLQNR